MESIADGDTSDTRSVSSKSSLEEATAMETQPNLPSDSSSKVQEEPVEMAMDRLLQRQRNEIMFELRRLQHGERPVTGQDHREAVENLIRQRLEPQPTPTERPEEIVVEVRGLVERRPVSSVLQSAAFRQSLENAIRGGLAQPRTARARVTANVVPTPPPLPTDRTQHTPQAPVTSSPGRASEWVESIPQAPAAARRETATWDGIEEAQRDAIIADISELLHQQIVTTSLDSQFRHVMEARMRDRVAQSGSNGRRVQEFIRSLPAAPRQRNDFSDLGIQLDQLSDEVSVISATAAVRVPQTQANTAMSRELKELRKELAEMKNLLRMSFDMQMDLQRAVRQEVAAAMATRAETDLPAKPTPPVADSHCLICLDETVDSVLYQCGHMCVCYTCGMQLRVRGAHCPVCRAPIKDIIRAFQSNSDDN